MAEALELHARCFGDSGPDLIFLHGLFGSSANWGSIAQSFSDRYRVHVLDLRNHGASPHADTMSYAEMANDVAHYMQRHCHTNVATFVGHSMGGKVAMELALTVPEKVSALVVEDIAPVTYKHDYQFIVDALLSLPLAALQSRAEADALLSEHFDDAAMRAFLLQNLSRSEGVWFWKPNLAAFSSGMSEIYAFRSGQMETYDGSICFIHGADSSYIGSKEKISIHTLFPSAEIHAIDGVGHWVHAEAKQEFLALLDKFLHKIN